MYNLVVSGGFGSGSQTTIADLSEIRITTNVNCQSGLSKLCCGMLNEAEWCGRNFRQAGTDAKSCDVCENDTGAAKRMRLPLSISEFLAVDNSGVAASPNAVHSTSAASLPYILSSGEIDAFPCKVFSLEPTCYLFVGRPSYKWAVDGEASWWQCPVVFVLRSFDQLPIKRIFPFDSGAFASKKFPDYITMFSMERFSLGHEAATVQSFLAAFYETPERFWAGDALTRKKMNERVRLTTTHMHVEALLRLYTDKSSPIFDDRSRVIELQVSKPVSISDGALLGIVLPEGYKDNPDFNEFFHRCGCQVEYYPVYPLSVSSYFAEIYRLVQKISS